MRDPLHVPENSGKAALALEHAELSRQEDAWIPAVEEAGEELARAQEPKRRPSPGMHIRRRSEVMR